MKQGIYCESTEVYRVLRLIEVSVQLMLKCPGNFLPGHYLFFYEHFSSSAAWRRASASSSTSVNPIYVGSSYPFQMVVVLVTCVCTEVAHANEFCEICDISSVLW